MTTLMAKDDELAFVLHNYSDIIHKKIGLKVSVSFFANCEQYADTVIPLTDNPLIYDVSPHEVFSVNIYQDFSIDEDVMLTDCNICTIDGHTFFKIVTPFSRARSYDFIVAKADEMVSILKKLKNKRDRSNFKKIDFPVIGLDFESIKRNTVDFLLNERFRAYCLKKRIKLKRGIILEGLPGTGKTLTLRWLKQEALKAGIEFKNFRTAQEFIDNREDYYDDKDKSIFIFEDFDTLLRERQDTNNSPNQILSQVLNTLEGVDDIQDVVSIFTTNKINLFDSAFIRPGRIDKVYSYGLPTQLQMLKFFEAYIIECAEWFPSIIEQLNSTSVNISYAILKGICDDINIFQFNNETITKEVIEGIVKDKLEGSIKNSTLKQTSDMIL